MVDRRPDCLKERLASVRYGYRDGMDGVVTKISLFQE